MDRDPSPPLAADGAARTGAAAPSGATPRHSLARKLAPRSLRSYLGWMLLLVATPVTLLGTYLAAADVIAQERRIADDAQRMATQIGTAVDHAVQTCERGLELLADLPNAAGEAPSDLFRAQAERFVVLFGAEVALWTADGQMLLSTRQAAHRATPQSMAQRSGRTALRLAASTKAVAVGDVFDSPRAGKALIGIAAPVLRQGRVVNIVSATLETSSFARFLPVHALPAGWSISLRDGTGRQLAGSGQSTGRTDPQAVVYTAVSTVTGWQARVEIPAAVARAPARDAALQAGGLLLLALAAALVGGSLAAHRLGQAVASLADEAEPPRLAARLREIEQARTRLAQSTRARDDAQAQAQQAHRALDETLARINDGIISIDRQWRFTYVNPAALKMFGQDADTSLVGRVFWDIFPEAHGGQWHQATLHALEHDIAGRVEFRNLSRGVWIEARIHPSRDGTTHFFTDITARRQAEDTLRESERRFRNLFEANAFPMWTVDVDTLSFLDVNDAAVRHYGYSREEFPALTVADIRPADEQAHLRESISAVLDSRARTMDPDGILRHHDAGGRLIEGFFRHRRKDGSVIDVDVTTAPLEVAGRRVRLVNAIDVTARLRLERERADAMAAREAASARLHELMARVSDGFVALDDAGHLVYVNDRALAVFGVPRAEQVLGQPAHASYPALADDPLCKAVQQAVQSGQPRTLEHRDLRSGAWFEWRLYPSADGISIYFADVSERRRAAEAQRESARRYRELFDANPHPMLVRDLDTQRILAANDAALQAYGYPRDELLALPLAALHPPQDQPRLHELVEQAQGHPDEVLHPAGHWTQLRKDGTPIEVEISSSGTHFADRPARLMVATVITERVQAQAERDQALLALRASEARLRALFEAIGDGVLLFDTGLAVLDANPAAVAMFGHAHADLLARQLQDLVPPAQREAMEDALIEMLDAGVGTIRLAEWTQQRRDGSTFEAEVGIRVAGHGRFVAVLRDSTERRAAQRALSAYQMELSELTQRLLTQERETTRHLAQTLHDQLGQSLAVARLRLDAAAARLGATAPAPLRDELDRVGSAVDQAIADVRLVLAELRPPMLEEQGLLAALDNEVRARALDDPDVDVLLEVDEGRLAVRWPAEVEYAALMIAREAILNAQRHAKASLVRVIVDTDGRSLQLEVIDDGQGIASELTRGRAGHLGIVGMRERALAIHARFAIEPYSAGGTRMVLHWPVATATGPGPGRTGA